jgi:tape measure domain-containing protein
MLVGEVWARMGLDSKQYEKSLDKLETYTEKRALTLGNIFRNAFSFTIGMGMFQAIQRGVRGTVGEAISFNSMMEQATIGFTTMLGSAERAQVFLDDMAEFAARTPFEFPDLLESAKRMLAMGFAAGDVLPTMEAVGNAAAGLGLGREGINRITLALGQMRAKAKVSGEEMRQLTEAGVPAWDMLSEAIGVSTAEVMKMSEKGLIPADKAIKIMTEGMNKRFPDMMKNMENTWQGVTSTIKDIWGMTIGALTSGLFKGLTTWLQGVRDWASDFYNTFRQFGLQAALTKSFGAEFAMMVRIVQSSVGAIVKYLSWWYGVLRRNWGMVKFVTTALLIYAVAIKTAAIAGGLLNMVTLALNGQLAAKIPLLSLVSTAVGIYRVQMALASAQGIVLTGVLAKLRLALYAVYTALGPVGWVLLGLSAVASGGIVMWGKYTKTLQQIPKVGIEKATDGANKALKDQADALKEAGKAANKNVQSFDEVHQLQEDMAGAGSADAFAIDDLASGIPDMDEMMADIEKSIEAAKPTLKGFWDWIKQGASNLWDGVKNKWNSFINWVKGWDIWAWIGNKWDSFKTWAGGMWDNVKQRWGSFTDWVQTRWSSLRATSGEIWEGIKNNVQSKWEALNTNALTIWENIRASITSKTAAARDFLVSVWDEVKAKMATVWGGIKSTAENAWGGIVNTIKKFINKIIDGFNWLISQLNKVKIDAPGWITSLFGVKSWGINIKPINPIPMAAGGIVTGPTYAMLGEAGPEAVVPLRNTEFMDALASAVGTAVMNALQFAQGGSQQGDIIIQLDGTTLARVLNPYINKETGRIGPAMITTV